MAALINVCDDYDSVARGTVPAVAGQVCQFGKIHDVSGNLIIVANTGTFYDIHCKLLTAVAEATYGFPTGVDSVVFTHSGFFPRVGLNSGSAFATGGNSIFSFGR